MGKNADELLRDVLELDARERGRFVVALLDTLSPEDDSVEDDAAWRAELRQRVTEAHAGTDDAEDCYDVLDALEREVLATRAARRTA